MCRTTLLAVLISSCSLMASATVCFAQCASGEALIGEDEENYHCAKLAAARCVAEKGHGLQSRMAFCKAQGLRCARDQGIPEKEALCVLGLYFSAAAATKAPLSPTVPYTLAAAAANCMVQQGLILRAWAPCEERMDECRTDALTTHKNAVRQCLRR